jgi:hypothetical protein
MPPPLVHPATKTPAILSPTSMASASPSGASPKNGNGKLVNMQGGFLIRHSRLTALGILLCVLAALFAVEAKIGWFSPAGSANAQISYAKARPAEPPKAPASRLAPSPSIADPFAQTALLVAAVLSLAALAMQATLLFPRAPRLSASQGLSVSLFFRPPPAR